MIEEIFSIPVYRSKIYISEDEYNFLVNQTRSPNGYMNEVSDDNFILDNLQLKDLRIQCEQHFQTFANDIMCFEGVTLTLTQSWVNYNKKGSSHHTHSHPNSVVSAVLYLTDSPSDLVMFKQVNPALSPNYKSINKYNSTSHNLKVSKNDIILFPSYVHHGVKLNEQDGERISLAINSFYTGVLGSTNTLSYLKVK